MTIWLTEGRIHVGDGLRQDHAEEHPDGMEAEGEARFALAGRHGFHAGAHDLDANRR